MNQKKIDNLRWKAKRSIKIIDLIVTGDKDQQIVAKIGCDRQLVQYYRNVINQE